MILFNNINSDETSEIFTFQGGSALVIVRADDFGGGTVTLETRSKNDTGGRFEEIASFTGDSTEKIFSIVPGLDFRVVLAGSTSPSNVFVETVGSSSEAVDISDTPLTIPNLKLWLDADDATTFTFVSGDISEWRDKSNDANNMTQSTASARPKRVTDSENNKPTVEFFGNDFMTVDSNIAGTQKTIFLVYKTTAVNPIGAAIVAGAVTFIIQRSAAAGPYQVLGLVTSALFETTSNRITSNIFTTSFTEVFIDGVSFGTGTGGTEFNLTFVQIGRRSDNLFVKATISELIIYDRTVNTSEREQVEQYLSLKWSIALS